MHSPCLRAIVTNFSATICVFLLVRFQNSNGLNGPEMSCGATHECLSMDGTMLDRSPAFTLDGRVRKHCPLRGQHSFSTRCTRRQCSISMHMRNECSAGPLKRNPLPIIRTFIVYLLEYIVYFPRSSGSLDLANMYRTCSCLLLAISPIDRSARFL